MRKKTDYRIEKLVDGDWYVKQDKAFVYLFRDGKMRDWFKAFKYYGNNDSVNKETHFGSKSAASRALNRYLRGGKK